MKKKMQLSWQGRRFRELYPPVLDINISQATVIIEKYVNSTLTQFQFDALVSFVSHLGEDIFKNSNILKRININEMYGAGNMFLVEGMKHGGSDIRSKEGALFLGNHFLCFEAEPKKGK